jgi:hypothetical protein
LNAKKDRVTPVIGEPHPDNITNTGVRAVSLERCPSPPTILDIADVVTFAVRRMSLLGQSRRFIAIVGASAQCEGSDLVYPDWGNLDHRC